MASKKRSTRSRQSMLQMWEDVKAGKVRPMDEYEFCNSKRTYDEAVKYLPYLDKYNQEGVESTSIIIQLWSNQDIMSFMYPLCSKDVHPDHWIELIEAYREREDKDVKFHRFLKEDHKNLWGDNATHTRERRRATTTRELQSALEKAQSELEEYIQTFDQELKRRDERIAELEDLLEAERATLSGDEFEKKLSLKDLNGEPDTSAGWALYEAFRHLQEEVLKHS